MWVSICNLLGGVGVGCLFFNCLWGRGVLIVCMCMDH